MTTKTNKVMLAVLALGVGTVLADNINGVNIDFVNIGNAGNLADSTGYGAVGNDYGISTKEISIDQFTPSGLGSGSGDTPVVNMTWHVAAQYANWLTSSNTAVGAYTISAGKVTAVNRAYRNGDGKLYVLPTEDEWYKAAYYTGSGYSLYANGTGTAPVAGTDANYNSGSPWSIGSGTVEQNGTYDMMGNVFEWLESPKNGALDLLDDTQEMVLRGGAYHLNNTFLQSGIRVTDPNLVRGAASVDTGIRIVAIPEPGTISLMSLSTLSLFAMRRIRRRKQAGKTLFPIGREYSCDTFGTKGLVEEDTDRLDELMLVFKAQMSEVWASVYAWYAGVDKVFWNRMVATHDRRVARRTAFKVAFKKKSLDRLDAFLARIMK